MRVQLLCQNPAKLNETTMLMEGEIHSLADTNRWLELCNETWEESLPSDKCGWMPLICTEDSKYFMQSSDRTQPPPCQPSESPDTKPTK